MLNRLLCLLSALTIALGSATAASSQKNEQEANSNREALMSAMEASRDEALAVLKRSSDFLTRQKSFRFEAHIGYDAVQPIGLKLEFGGERKILVRRPDHFRVEVSNRSGERSIIRFDGKTLSSFFPEENAFATLDKPGSIEQTIAYLSDDIGLPIPLSDFMESNFYEAVVGDIELGVLVGEEKVGNYLCDHLAFKSADLVFQLWVETGDKPLPRRVVITYEAEEKTPQFWAQIHYWELGVKAGDEAFTFSPPKGAERLLTRPVSAETAKEVRP